MAGRLSRNTFLTEGSECLVCAYLGILRCTCWPWSVWNTVAIFDLAAVVVVVVVLF